MKSILLSVFVCFVTLMVAQPSYLSTDAPRPGIKTTNANVDTIGAINVFQQSKMEAPGGNKSWNYATLIKTGEQTIEYVDPVKANLTKIFPTATVASYDSENDEYLCFKKSATEMRLLGQLSMDDTLVFINPLLVTKFPVTFGSTFYDSTVNPLLLDTFTASLTVVTNAIVDSWGMILTPAGGFPALRIHLKQKQTGFLSGFPILEQTSDNYSWLSPGYADPVLTCTFNAGQVFGNTITETTADYLQQQTTGVFDHPISRLKISCSPNPTTDLINISFSSANTNNYSISLIDILGKVVYNTKLDNVSGDYTHTISATAFEAGNYLVQVVNQDNLEFGIEMVSVAK